MFFKADIHGPFGLFDVAGVTGFVGFSCTWGVVDHSGFRVAWEFVLEVDELMAK
jgi:hypothetical protein